MKKSTAHGRKLARERDKHPNANRVRDLALGGPVGRATAKQQAARRATEFNAYMRKISLRIYLADDGEQATDLLASLAFALGVGANIGLNIVPDCPETRRMHAALRTVVQLSVDGGRWRAVQAKILHEAAELAKEAFLAYPQDGADVFEAASYLSSRVADGTARMGDVAGSEIYNKQPACAMRTDVISY